MDKDTAVVADAPKIISQSVLFTPATGQCDACSPIIFAKAQYLRSDTIRNLPLQAYPELVEQPINSTNHAFLSPLSESFSVLNSSAKQILQFFRPPATIGSLPIEWNEKWGRQTIEKTIYKMVSLGLLVDKNNDRQKFQEKPEKLAAWLHITDRCNLRCAYCYLPHNKVDMSKEIGYAAINATYRSAIKHNYREVKFKYAGGEPLLRYQFVKTLHNYARNLADKQNLMLDGIILSNGTCLTAEIIESMLRNSLRLMISLDGIGDSHNKQRFYANGHGSADDVLCAIDLALSYGLIPDISITVTSRNTKGLPELINWILKRNLPFTLNFYRENEYSKSHSDLKIEEEIIINGILAAFKVIEENLPRRSLLASLADRANLSAAHLRTCSVGHSYLVFDYLGQVSKCQMQIDNPVTSVEAEDPLAIVRADTNGIQNIQVEEKEGCRSCNWKYWCTGGCPLVTFRATGRYDIKSPDCNIYKALYPEILRLEGLRLLKYSVN